MMQFNLKCNASVFIYSFFDQNVNYLTDGKGKKDGAQPTYVVALSYVLSKTGHFKALVHPLTN